ncbi:hypothetical protein DYB32_010486 [Aphanomyces invadans]|uniref:mannosyl-oligosaccharide glucosidase n=1 Tax=Aphanomyces invadans TaxID=157072 RepID=A0A418AG34_9STRA|nr:hypothetical protein DYB32_010486 [Aphanomyces invadans]
MGTSPGSKFEVSIHDIDDAIRNRVTTYDASGTLAEARVPAEFITQFTTHANPPTLLLSVDKLLSHIVGTPILDSWWPKLQRWFEWYRRTQAGPEPNTFRWRGRDVHDGKLMPNTLSSGLDDYPRASHPSEDERHVDLAAWMIKVESCVAVMAKVAKAVGDDAKASSYDSLSLSFLSTMDKLHWDTATSLYFDYGLHSDDGIFEDHIVIRCQNPSTGDRCEALQFVRRVGYVSFFPLFLQLLPLDSPKLQPLGTQVAQHLLSPHGLLSLSPEDLYFDRPNAPGDAPYWRGPIWININYLALTSFKHYATHAMDKAVRSQYQALYSSLREGVVTSIVNEFDATGYLYEQYDQRTGRGQRCHPFSGWTALIVNILAETY